MPLVASSLSLDDSGAGSLVDSADVPFVASLSLDDDRGADVLLVASLLLVLESASPACGGFFLDPTVMMVPLLFF